MVEGLVQSACDQCVTVDGYYTTGGGGGSLEVREAAPVTGRLGGSKPRAACGEI